MNMRIVTLLAGLTVAAACSSTPEATTVLLPPLETAVFIIERGDSVVATETTRRWADRLEGEVEVPGRARAEYVATLSATGTVVRLDATLRPWDGAGSEVLRIDPLVDSVAVRSSRWNGIEQRLAGRAAVVYLHPSPALLELILRRALAAPDGSPEVGVWLANQNMPAVARVTPVDGAMQIEFAGTRIRAVHQNGALLLGQVPSLGWTFRRRDPP